MRKFMLAGAACAALAMTACDGGKAYKADSAAMTPGSIAPRALESLSGKRIFFGHQSVGWNIIDGLKDIAREKAWDGFNFVEARTPGAAPGFYHVEIGANGDPLGKIKDFEAIIRGGMGDKVDIALMKLCYLDIDAKTDVDALYAAYREALRRLEADYPRLVLVRATVPLTAEEGGLKALAKRILGRPTAGSLVNVARERLNEMIRAECAASGKPLFDLASAESSRADGKSAVRLYRGEAYLSLRGDFTTDGGHLNEVGRKVAAERLLASLIAVE